MEEDIFERDLEKEKGEDMLNEAIEVLNANFSTDNTSPNTDTFCDFNFGQPSAEQFFRYNSPKQSITELTAEDKNFVESQDNPWETILPCTVSSIHKHSPESTVFQSSVDNKNLLMRPVGLDIHRDTSSLNDGLYRTHYHGSHNSVSSSWEVNYTSSHDWGSVFQNGPFVVPNSNYSQPAFFTAYSGPRESDRVITGTERSPSYMSFSSRCAGREHFHFPCLNSSLSGSKLSNSVDSLPKRNVTPTAFCSWCMQNISANGGNFQRHQEACKRRHGLANEGQSTRTKKQALASASMAVNKSNKSPLLTKMEEDSRASEDDEKDKMDKATTEDNRDMNIRKIQSILSNFREPDDREMYVLRVLQELRNTLVHNLDANCIKVLRESFMALAERSKKDMSAHSTISKAPLPGEQVAMAVLFYASCG